MYYDEHTRDTHQHTHMDVKLTQKKRAGGCALAGGKPRRVKPPPLVPLGSSSLKYFNAGFCKLAKNRKLAHNPV